MKKFACIFGAITNVFIYNKKWTESRIRNVIKLFNWFLFFFFFFGISQNLIILMKEFS